MIELDHSPLGASGANRWLNCEGSFLLHRDLLESGEFENSSSTFAELGTDAHELAAICLTEQREPFEYIGRQFGNSIVGNNEDQINPTAVAVYVNECERIWPRDGKGTFLIEKTIKCIDLHPLLKGTVDFGYWSPKRGMFLRDYKNGSGVAVSSVDNKQLLYYAFLMVLDAEWLRSAPDDFPVSLAIVQPNYYGLFDPIVDWQTDLGTVRRFGFDLLLPKMSKLYATRDIDNDDFVYGEHCQFCPVLLRCPKAQSAYEEFANGEEFVEMLTNEELDRFFGMKPLARRFMNALDNVVEARVIAGAQMVSAKMVEKKTNRVWKPEAEKAVVEAFGDRAYTVRTLLSPAAVEKLSSQGKQLAIEYGYKPEAGGLVLASVDDPRPAAIPQSSNAKVFAQFEQSPEQLGW